MPTKHLGLLFAALGAASLSLSACCRVPRPTAGPSDAEGLLDLVRAQSRSLTSVRGELRVDHMGPAGRVAGKVYAFARDGGRLRLEAVSPMETPIRTVAVDGVAGTFTMTDQEEQRCLHGPADPCLLGDAIGVEMSSEHVGATLVGSVPLLRHAGATARWNRCGYYEVELEGVMEGWAQTVRIGHEQGRLVVAGTVIAGPDGTVLEVEHEAHRLEGELALPERTSVRTPGSGGDLRVIWRSRELGVDLPDSAWQARCPDGFPTETPVCQRTTELPPLEEPAAPVEPDPEPDPSGEGEGAAGEDDLSEELGL